MPNSTDRRDKGAPVQSDSGNRVLDNNLSTVERITKQLERKRSPVDAAIDGLTAFASSKTFIIAHLVWYGGWILLNTLGPAALRFDPLPFNFLTLIVSLEAIFLSTFILITQSHEVRLADLRENLDLQINLLSEQENTKMLQMLQAIHEKLGISDDGDRELPEMKQDVKTEQLARQIEELLEQRRGGRKKST